MSANSAARHDKTAATVVPPTQCAAFPDLEYSVHIAPKSLKRDVAPVFPAQLIKTSTPLLIIPIFQRAAVPLLEFGDVQATEKDRLLLRFFAWHDAFSAALAIVAPDAWTDATDPASGVARHGPHASCYSDVNGIIRVMSYPTQDAGGCHIVRHPTWGYAVYPATVFTTADVSAVRNALESLTPPSSS